MNITHIRNPHAVQRLQRRAQPEPAVAPEPVLAPEPAPAPEPTWGPLAEPVDPLDTWHRMRAQSALTGMAYRDGSRSPDTLTLGQARDVLAWYRPRSL